MLLVIVTLASNITIVKYKNCGATSPLSNTKDSQLSLILYNNYEQIAGTI